MRILVMADRAPDKRIQDILAESQINLIVTLGDLELSQIRDLENVTNIPKIGVYGNHCSGMYMPGLGIENMHLATKTIGGITFGGFEGCVRYKQSSAPMYTQEEASVLLSAFPHVDVMLVHCPPSGVNDDQTDIAHTGFIGLREYVEREKPAYLFHGHTYPTVNELVTQFGETKIEYVFGNRVIEIPHGMVIPA